MEISKEAVAWLASGQRGASSNTIFTHLTGVDALGGWDQDHPYDPADFRRCALLLKEVPELKAEFLRMSEVSPAWARLVQHWGEISALLDHEAPGWLSRTPDRALATRAYALIQKCIGREF